LENISNATYVESLRTIQRIKESIIFSKIPLDSSLFGLHYLADMLQRQDDKEWAELELKGYYVQKNLPEYRKDIFGHFRFYNVPDDVIQKLDKAVKHELAIDVPRLVHLIQFGDPMITFGVGNVEEINKEYQVNIQINQISQVFARATLVQLVGSITIELMNRLEKIESEIKSKVGDIKTSPDNETSRTYDKKKIFIVHGKDEIAKRELEEILRDRLKLEPIILMNRPNEGKTLVEKFENHILQVGYAFVIITPDDVGCLKSDYLPKKEDWKEVEKLLENRARQNVILELGYFVGNLGRNRICCIQKGNDELLPSDLHGLVTIRYMESIKDKYLEIEDELKKAGYFESGII